MKRDRTVTMCVKYSLLDSADLIVERFSEVLAAWAALKDFKIVTLTLIVSALSLSLLLSRDISMVGFGSEEQPSPKLWPSRAPNF